MFLKFFNYIKILIFNENCRIKNGTIENDYIGISGEPGSGKSFLSTILSREFLKKDILCLTISLQSVRVSKKLSLVKFLLQNCTIDFYPGEYDLKNLNNLLKYNQNKVVIIMDGLDQVKGEITLSDELPDIEDEETSLTWLGYLMGRKILKKCKLFVTSRPLAFIELNGDLQPTELFSLYDFEDSRVLKALEFYFPNTSDNIYKKIKEAEIINIAQHPMSAFLIGTSYNDGDYDLADTTLYQMYMKLFEKYLSKTKVAATKKPNFQALMRKIEEICYNMIKSDQYVVTTELLKDYVPITLKDFEDVLTVDAGSKAGTSYQVDENEKVVVFNHQLVLVSYFTTSLLCTSLNKTFIYIPFKNLLKFVLFNTV